MEKYITDAFKSLKDLNIELDEYVEPEERQAEPQTILDLFKDKVMFNVIQDIDTDDGQKISIYCTATCNDDGDVKSCDEVFGEFNDADIEGVIVDVLDGERNFKGTLHGVDLNSPLEEVNAKAIALFNGEDDKVIFEPDREDGASDNNTEEPADAEPETPEEEEEPESNKRLFLGNEEPEDDNKGEEEKEEEKPEEETEIVGESLNESKSFDITDKDDLAEAEKLIDNNKNDEGVEQVVDISAETKEDLKKSYVGSIILRCPTCHTMIYKDPADLVRDETNTEEEIYNIDEECPHCGAKDGFEAVGQVASLETDANAVPEAPMKQDEPQDEHQDEQHDEEQVETEPAKEADFEPIPEQGEPEQEKVEEALEDKYFLCKIFGGYNCQELLADNVEVYAKDEESAKEEALKVFKEENNVKDEDNPYGYRVEIGSKEEEDMDESCCKEEKVEESIIRNKDIVLESLDEEGFNRLIRRYLHETYFNIKAFTATGASIDDENNKVIIEGRIKFRSGKEKDTKFVFEAKELTKKGKIKFSGMNETFSDKEAYTLVCDVKDNKLLSESLSYSYKINDNKVCGKVTTPKRR